MDKFRSTLDRHGPTGVEKSVDSAAWPIPSLHNKNVLAFAGKPSCRTETCEAGTYDNNVVFGFHGRSWSKRNARRAGFFPLLSATGICVPPMPTDRPTNHLIGWLLGLAGRSSLVDRCSPCSDQ